MEATLPPRPLQFEVLSDAFAGDLTRRYNDARSLTLGSEAVYTQQAFPAFHLILNQVEGSALWADSPNHLIIMFNMLFTCEAPTKLNI